LKKLVGKENFIIFTIIIVAIILIIVGNRVAMGKTLFFDEINDLIQEKATVIEVLEDTAYNDDDVILFTCKISAGENKGKIVTAGQIIDPNMGLNIKAIEKGDKIYLGDSTGYDIGADWFMYDYNRFGGIVWLAAGFAVLLLLFGRSKGLRTIISLALTCITIFFVFIPAIITGFNIYICSILSCLFITFITLLIVQGPNAKSLAAGLGCCGGLLVVSVLTLVMSEILKISGLVDEDALYLLYLETENPINLKAIIFAAITLGAMGAILDIAVDIAASLSEVHRHASKRSLQRTIKSGITIGQDIVGSMSNTLILAYIGSSLSVILLLLIHSGSLEDLLNSELIVVEILQALAGSIGILFTIPLTSISCGVLYNMSKKEKELL
jgi:uncharacterized membrane protein